MTALRILAPKVICYWPSSELPNNDFCPLATYYWEIHWIIINRKKKYIPHSDVQLPVGDQPGWLPLSDSAMIENLLSVHCFSLHSIPIFARSVQSTCISLESLRSQTSSHDQTSWAHCPVGLALTGPDSSWIARLDFTFPGWIGWPWKGYCIAPGPASSALCS